MNQTDQYGLPALQKKQKKPRQYAAEIANLSTLPARRNALANVPPEFQELVKTHLTNIFNFKKTQR